jgi:hypothetical protein
VSDRDAAERSQLRRQVHQRCLDLMDLLGEFTSHHRTKSELWAGFDEIVKATRRRKANGPHRDLLPDSKLQEFEAKLNEALQAALGLWTMPERSLRDDFIAAGRELSCGPLLALSYHDLVISLVRFLLEPESSPDDASITGLERVQRHWDVFRAFCDGEFDPQRVLMGLEQEHAKVQNLPPSPASDVSSARPSKPPHGIPPGWRKLVEIQAELGVPKTTAHRHAVADSFPCKKDDDGNLWVDEGAFQAWNTRRPKRHRR